MEKGNIISLYSINLHTLLSMVEKRIVEEMLRKIHTKTETDS